MRTSATIAVIAFSLFAAGAAEAQTIKPRGGGVTPWLGCCAHCSTVQCSGCSETTPLEVGKCDGKIANCTTRDDVTTCKPAP